MLKKVIFPFSLNPQPLPIVTTIKKKLFLRLLLMAPSPTPPVTFGKCGEYPDGEVLKRARQLRVR